MVQEGLGWIQAPACASGSKAAGSADTVASQTIKHVLHSNRRARCWRTWDARTRPCASAS